MSELYREKSQAEEEIHSLSNSNKSEVDDAFDIALQARELEITDEIEKRISSKINWYIQPIIFTIYALQYMDKVTNGFAGVMGIQKDLGLVGDQFAWLGTGFYLAYLIAEFPIAQALQRLPFVKTLSFCIIVWGITLCAHAGAHNSAQIITARVFLGIFESSITPGFVILSSQWYKKSQQFAFTALWFSCNGAGGILGGLIAYGLLHHADSLVIESWRVLFLVTGLLTVLFGIVFYFYVPENPSKAWFLTEEEKLYHVQRIRENQQGFGNKKFKWYQVKEAFTDIRTWIYIFWGLVAQIPNGGLGSFSSILLNQTLGYSKEQALLMGLPSGAIQIASGIITGYIANKTQKRILVGTGCCAITFIGMCLLAFTSHPKSQLGGYYIIPFFAIGIVTILSSIASDAAGHTKKVTVSAAFLVAYCIGNVIGPQTFKASDAPGYTPARVTMAVCLAIATVTMFSLLLVNIHENRKRDRKFAEDPNYYIAPENAEFLDLTDFENKNFRYSY
ncbi:putative membrane protein [Wickerhamomyces ciferrii]|uniref:Membrane protein n=1 Tax=Wickerhamomyces ciferrii (strain ATCC 14091 / BCRC 22168 / CBS 111 / JCM 3599 / NBRC 0793 / NRRL Y-1031 F-60-10) TaxID=1206466 RepID=K0KX02_WICCF|nr:uncharacterized protein BN7_5606 [Wickerhamomyces ciferrii]CCH46019.1 putative membrane protein [Wickerhamomyces ciferrii]